MFCLPFPCRFYAYGTFQYKAAFGWQKRDFVNHEHCQYNSTRQYERCLYI